MVEHTALVGMTTLGNQPVLNDAALVRAFAAAWQSAESRFGCAVKAYVFLPDHAHLLLATAEGTTVDDVVQQVRQRFEADYRVLLGMPQVEPLWQRSYRLVRPSARHGVADLADYIHYNPVRHGLVQRPDEWLYSSFQAWMQDGHYKLGWGWTPPASIQQCNWE